MPLGTAGITPEQAHEFGFDELRAVFGRDTFSRYQPVRDCLSAINEREMREPHWYLTLLAWSQRARAPALEAPFFNQF